MVMAAMPELPIRLKSRVRTNRSRVRVPLRGGTNLRCSATPKGARHLVAAAGKQLLEMTACNFAIAFDTNEDPPCFAVFDRDETKRQHWRIFFSCARLA
jgi:hypothetical protein